MNNLDIAKALYRGYTIKLELDLDEKEMITMYHKRGFVGFFSPNIYKEQAWDLMQAVIDHDDCILLSTYENEYCISVRNNVNDPIVNENLVDCLLEAYGVLYG